MAGGLIDSGKVSPLFWPGLAERFGVSYDRWETQYTVFTNIKTSEKNFEKIQMMEGFGLAQEKDEGAPPAGDTAGSGFFVNFQHKEYANSFQMTQIALEDQQYEKYYDQAEDMAEGVRQTRENLATDILNNGFDTAFIQDGGDGKPLFDTAHISGPEGLTYSNKLSVAAALSPSSLKALATQINTTDDPRGLKMQLQPQCVIVPSALQFDIEVILNSVLDSDSASNAINSLMSKNTFPEGYRVNRYLESDTAFFIKTSRSERQGIYEWVRREVNYGSDNDFLTSNAIFKVDFRTSYSWGEGYCMFATEGA